MKALRSWVYLALFVAVVCMPHISHATTPGLPGAVPESCDPEFYQVMRSTAWLQGNRDNETAERLILKPDSVLQYSCFASGIVGAAASNSVFTTSSYGPNISGLIGSASGAYFTNNFAHPMGGGSLNAVPSSPCVSMQAVWQQLKCRNFDKADFRTFAEMRDDDRRVFPDVCAEPGARAQLWQDYIDLAYPVAGGAGALDILDTYLTITRADVAPSCGAPIPTGLLRGIDGRDGPDAVCIVPGCYYTGRSCTR